MATKNLIIRTSYHTDAKGAGRITAKGGGKQRTIAYDLNRSNAYNHGAAAGTLGYVLGVKMHPDVLHDSNESGTKHGFFF
jgi:hypothetical protein